MKKYLIVLLTSLLLVTGCATSVTSDIKVDSEADATIKFSGYKTYAWLGSASILYDPAGKWEPPGFDADAEIKFLIDREFTRLKVNPPLIAQALKLFCTLASDCSSSVHKFSNLGSRGEFERTASLVMKLYLARAVAYTPIWQTLLQPRGLKDAKSYSCRLRPGFSLLPCHHRLLAVVGQGAGSRA